MIPALQADEALRAVSVGAIAGGHVKREKSGSVIRRWEREASRLDPTGRQGSKNRATRGLLAAVGIGVRIPKNG